MDFTEGERTGLVWLGSCNGGNFPRDIGFSFTSLSLFRLYRKMSRRPIFLLSTCLFLSQKENEATSEYHNLLSSTPQTLL